VVNAIPPDVLGGIVLAVGAVAGGLKLWAVAQAALAGSSLVDYIAAFAEVAAEAGVAETAMAAGMVAIDAVNPVIWAVGAAAAVGLFAAALAHINVASTTIVGQFQQQQAAIGYNISGYQKLAATISAASAGYEKFAQSSTDAVRGGAAGAQVLSQQLAQQSTAVSAAAVVMGSRLSALSQGLGVSTTVIEQWASAAGISASKFSGAGENVQSLTTQIVAFVNKNPQAVTAASSLATNIDIFSNGVFNATTQLDAFNQIWNTLVGNLLNKQTAVTQSDQQFQNLQQTIKQNGASSTATAQSFQAYIAQIGTSVSALQKGGASVSSLNGYLQTQIDHITSLGPLNKQEQADLTALKTFQDALANSTHGLTDNQLTWIQQAEGHILPDLIHMHADTPVVNADINNLANAIAQTGKQSSVTAADRAQLIKDLEASGVNAKTATGQVDGWITALSKVPKSVSTAISVSASAAGTISAAVKSTGTNSASIQNIAADLYFGAMGGYITGPGGPTDDMVPAWLSSGEYVIQAASVDKYGKQFLDMVNAQKLAAGGTVNLNGPSQFVGSDSNNFVTDMGEIFMNAMNSAFQAQAAQAATAAATAFVSSQGATGGFIQSLMKNMAAARGWTGSEWNALAAVETREAGFNMTAQNPTSGAYGLAQFINGPSEYAQYGGNSTTASGQITAMLNYISQRYGDPINAWQHEVDFGWYGDGGPINEPVMGWGVNSGRGYVLGEKGPEWVVPQAQMEAMAERGGGGGNAALLARLDQLIQVAKQAPAATGQHVGAAIGGAAQGASFRDRYPRYGALCTTASSWATRSSC
jgi:hypothetical protein